MIVEYVLDIIKSQYTGTCIFNTQGVSLKLKSCTIFDELYHIWGINGPKGLEKKCC